MPNSRSARKNVRKNATNRARNRWRLDRVRSAVKAFDATVHAGDAAKAQEQLTALYKLLDQVASTNSLHKNTASRYKSRATLRFNAMKKPKAA